MRWNRCSYPWACGQISILEDVGARREVPVHADGHGFGVPALAARSADETTILAPAFPEEGRRDLGASETGVPNQRVFL